MNKKILIAVSIAALFFLSIASNANANTNRPNQKRQASSGKRNIRSATGGSAPATSRSTARNASSQGRNSSRQQANRKRIASGRTSTSTGSSSNGSICPIETIVKRVIDEQGLETFYNEKTTICKSPAEQLTNVLGNNNSDGLKRPGWIAGKDIYVFHCAPGTTLSKNNNTEECASVVDMCPLNEVIKKVSTTEYISLNTNTKCKIPTNSTLENLTGAKNTRSDVLTDDEAYKLKCNANYYSTQESNLTIKCTPCAIGTYSPSGSTSTADCKPPVK